MSTTSQTSSSSTAAHDWDQVRAAFSSSIMVDTALSSLAQNLDGLDWPFRGPDEKPSTYLDFTYAEIAEEFASRRHPDAVALLTQILRETLDFDQPFGEMVRQTEAFAQRDNPLLQALGRLGISENFPIELSTLDVSARDLCRLEEVTTLGEFALFAQRLSQGIIVGGDLRRLLNALAHVDERALAELLPFRPGTTGLHFAEALVHASASPDAAERVMGAVAWFHAEFEVWQSQVATNPAFVTQQFSQLHKPELSRRIHELLAPHLGIEQAAPTFWSSVRRFLRLKS